jgi:tetratricopeptide (TPR) repeat protein
MGSKEVIARFGAERQALAMMSHPCISQVFDAGTTEEGLPYFVMEYVAGERITDYCSRRGMDVRSRIRLMEQVCLAVEHAHQKGVIHRDIKPSNVLVAEVNGEPAPKVIDFGIVKAVGATLTGHADVTMTAQIVGTPQYMSPEQASFGEVDVDTRSDVYGLGALLYEVLTGSPVYDSERVRGMGAADLERMIREEQPVRPSKRVVETEGKEDATRLARELRRDMDWIIGRALEKERVRRYPTANALAMDLRRYLDGEAVMAGPPSGTYRMRKFVSRHRIEASAVMAVALALVGIVVIALTTAAESERAHTETARELRKFEEIATFTEQIISGIDPAIARGMDTELLQKVLRGAAERLDTEPPSEAEVEVRLRTMIGQAQTSVADWEGAERQLRAASALAHGSDTIPEALVIEVDASLGEMLAESGRYIESYDIFMDGYHRRVALFGEEDERTLEALSNAGVMLHKLDRWEEAVQVHQRLFDIRTRTLGEDHEDTIASMNNLASNLGEVGRVDESIGMLRVVVAKQEVLLGEDHPHTLMTKNNLAGSLQEAGRLGEAEEILRDVMRTKSRVYEPHHPSMLIAMNNLASLLGEMGSSDEAIEILSEAAEIAAESTGETSSYTLTLRHNLVTNMMRSKQYEEALEVQLLVSRGFREVMGEMHPRSVASRSQIASIYRNLGRASEALVESEWCLQAAGEAYPDGHRMHGTFTESHGLSLAAVGRHEEAIGYLELAYGVFEAATGGDDASARKCAGSIVESYQAIGDAAGAAHWTGLAGS